MLSYAHNGMPGSDPSGPYDSAFSLEVNPQYLHNKSCKISVGMSRSTSARNRTAKFGNYYYGVTGSPYDCGNQLDDTLMTEIRGEFEVQDIVPIGN